MKQISELQDTLSHFLDWNKARLNCLVQILQALFTVRTVNLTQIATAFRTQAKEASSYRRIRRFFTEFSFDISRIVFVVLRLFPLEGKYLLILDRTNWKWGKTPINILMLSVAYRGIAIPLFWAVLNLEGNSCPEDRISILQRVLQHFGIQKIEALLADREFVGKAWFRFLIDTGIPFDIRIKQNAIVQIDANTAIPVKHLRRYLGLRKVVNHPVNLWGYSLYISVEKRKGAQEALIIVSSRQFEDPLGMYKRRWEIETLFGCLKSRGFRMEDTHIVDADKIEKLLFVLAIAFCWAYRTGDIRVQEEPIEIKTHGRPAKSIFRWGLDLIRRAIFANTDLRNFRELLTCFISLKT
ncbi:MAG: hypothetical protein FD118_4256, partial [Rhodocyclaceae bacterium]